MTKQHSRTGALGRVGTAAGCDDPNLLRQQGANHESEYGQYSGVNEIARRPSPIARLGSHRPSRE